MHTYYRPHIQSPIPIIVLGSKEKMLSTHTYFRKLYLHSAVFYVIISTWWWKIVWKKLHNWMTVTQDRQGKIALCHLCLITLSSMCVLSTRTLHPVSSYLQFNIVLLCNAAYHICSIRRRSRLVLLSNCRCASGRAEQNSSRSRILASANTQ